MRQVHKSLVMTIRELAHLAGVSHSTVSRALLDNPRLPLKTRQTIQALAKKHGYQPHPMISKLMAQLPQIRTIARSTLAVVTTDLDWRQAVFPSQIYAGIEERAAELGYLVEEFKVSAYESSRRLSDVLYSRGIEGLLVFPLKRDMGHLSLNWPRFTSVAIGRTLTRPNLHRVSFSHFENFMLAARHLRRLGYRRIALALMPELQSRVGDTYIAGYTLLDRAIPVAERIPVFEEPSFRTKDVVRWLKKYRADALVCNYDPTHLDLATHGVRIPEELGYVTLDCLSAPPEASGIQQHPGKVGAAAVEMLTAHLHRNDRGLPEFPTLTYVQGTWSPGKTVRKQTGRIGGRKPAKPAA